MIFSSFNLRLAGSGPTIEAQNNGDTLVWDAALGKWVTGPGGGDWLQDYQIRSRADLVSVVAPVGGVFTLPAGSYGIKGLVLNTGENILVESRVRLYGAQSIISAVGTDVIVDVSGDGELTLDSIRVNGRLRQSGANASCRAVNSRFSVQAGPTYIGNGGNLWATNCVFAANLANAIAVNAGSHRFDLCDLLGDASSITGTASVELYGCQSSILAVNEEASLVAMGGDCDAVSILDGNRVHLGGGLRVTGGDGSPVAAVRANPANFLGALVIDGCVLTADDGVSLENAADIHFFDCANTQFVVTNGIRFAGGPVPVGGGALLTNCRFSCTAAAAQVGFTDGSVRWFVRSSFASDSPLTETAPF